MEIFHNSYDIKYREPSGAVPTGTEIKISIRTDFPAKVTMRLFTPYGEKKVRMEEQTDLWYNAKIQAGDTPCLIWYDFIAEAEGEFFYYSNSDGALGGIGTQTSYPVANSYQITVYDKSFKTPEWFGDRIMYQIFPDRFYVGEKINQPENKRNKAVYHFDWHEKPFIDRHPFENGPAYNDFYGGNLKGIIEKLPYLKELGVGVLYLNPIFEAYSNHRYDTGDYKKIDSILGTEEDFKELCSVAKEKYDIRIILDGVFSHTGADSIYFNKYGFYGENTGAYQDYNSPYRSWFQFGNYPDYASWWGCSNLPNVNEMENSYLDYILRDENSVIKKWLSAGASGWRLDVADELPDEFIEILRREAKSEKEDAVIIGEVWEDASNKTAYGKLRNYLMGAELDSVMNYPFRDGVISFLTGYGDADAFNRQVMSQLENYPMPVVYSLMNILGTHDTMRIKSIMGGFGEDCGDKKLPSQMEETAVKRVMMASFMQMTFYGVPCIYYGDEVGMEGGKDPHNRATYPWRCVDTELREWYKKLAEIRNNTLCLKRGYFIPLYAKGDVYVYLRCFKDGKDPLGRAGDESLCICAINRGESYQELELTFDFNSQLKEILYGEQILTNQNKTINIPPNGVLLFMK